MKYNLYKIYIVNQLLPTRDISTISKMSSETCRCSNHCISHNEKAKKQEKEEMLRDVINKLLGHNTSPITPSLSDYEKWYESNKESFAEKFVEKNKRKPNRYDYMVKYCEHISSAATVAVTESSNSEEKSKKEALLKQVMEKYNHDAIAFNSNSLSNYESWLKKNKYGVIEYYEKEYNKRPNRYDFMVSYCYNMKHKVPIDKDNEIISDLISEYYHLELVNEPVYDIVICIFSHIFYDSAQIMKYDGFREDLLKIAHDIKNRLENKEQQLLKNILPPALDSLRKQLEISYCGIRNDTVIIDRSHGKLRSSILYNMQTIIDNLHSYSKTYCQKHINIADENLYKMVNKYIEFSEN